MDRYSPYYYYTGKCEANQEPRESRYKKRQEKKIKQHLYQECLSNSHSVNVPYMSVAELLRWKVNPDIINMIRRNVECEASGGMQTDEQAGPSSLHSASSHGSGPSIITNSPAGPSSLNFASSHGSGPSIITNSLAEPSTSTVQEDQAEEMESFWSALVKEELMEVPESLPLEDESDDELDYDFDYKPDYVPDTEPISDEEMSTNEEPRVSASMELIPNQDSITFLAWTYSSIASMTPFWFVRKRPSVSPVLFTDYVMPELREFAGWSRDDVLKLFFWLRFIQISDNVDYELLTEEMAEVMYMSKFRWFVKIHVCSRCKKRFLTINGRDNLHVRLGLCYRVVPVQCKRCNEHFKSIHDAELHTCVAVVNENDENNVIIYEI